MGACACGIVFVVVVCRLLSVCVRVCVTSEDEKWQVALFSLGTVTPLRGAGKKQAARPLFFKPNNDGNEQHGWQFCQSCPARQKVGPQRNGEISLRHAISVDPNATNSPLMAQGRLVQDLGSRSPTARRLAKFARTTCDGRQSPNKQRNGTSAGSAFISLRHAISDMRFLILMN